MMLILAGWPVWRITHAGAPPSFVATPTGSQPTTAKARLQVEFLPVPPLEFDAKYLGQSIWRGGGKLTEDSPPLEMTVPAEGVDLQITARWPAEITTAAARIRLTTPDGATLERQAWTRQGPSLDEVLTFQLH